jgi:ubiquinone/menaquinone biosynthesis C-methylase UbiE
MNTAKWYDADNREVFQADIPFYLERALRLGGNTLELACGTGRITIPLAKAGVSVYGLDYSESMLEVLNDKIRKLPLSTGRKLRSIHGDMTNFSLEEQFRLIFIPFRSFQALENDEQALQCLQSVYRHLEDNGQFIINVFRPLKEMGDWWRNSEEQLDFTSSLPTGETLTRHSIRSSIHTNERLLYTDYIFRLYRHDGIIEERHDKLRLRYYYGEELRGLLHSTGFRIDEEYGWYDGRPVSEGHEYIWVCSKI